MKILLLGEYSSLHRYLKEGILELGNYNVTLAGTGDGWKNIPGRDITLYEEFKPGIKYRFQIYLKPFYTSNVLRDYDVIQLINPIIYSCLNNELLLRKILKKNNCIALVAAGYDYALFEAYKKGTFEYYAYDYDSQATKLYNANTVRGKLNIRSDMFVRKKADIIIPSLYEYKIGYTEPKTTKVIPFPINTCDIKYKENKIGNKIVFFHGINRELAKGTPFIREAFERLKKNYPNDVEIIVDGQMPFEKYIEIMNRANVVVDQCCSYGYGINACIAMAQGKVVMTGCKKETLDALGVDDAPMFHAEPNTEQLYCQMQYIVENKKSIPQWGYESRKYVENVHNYIKIAQRYVKAWKSTGKI